MMRGPSYLARLATPPGRAALVLAPSTRRLLPPEDERPAVEGRAAAGRDPVMNEDPPAHRDRRAAALLDRTDDPSLADASSIDSLGVQPTVSPQPPPTTPKPAAAARSKVAAPPPEAFAPVSTRSPPQTLPQTPPDPARVATGQSLSSPGRALADWLTAAPDTPPGAISTLASPSPNTAPVALSVSAGASPPTIDRAEPFPSRPSWRKEALAPPTEEEKEREPSLVFARPSKPVRDLPVAPGDEPWFEPKPSHASPDRPAMAAAVTAEGAAVRIGVLEIRTAAAPPPAPVPPPAPPAATPVGAALPRPGYGWRYSPSQG